MIVSSGKLFAPITITMLDKMRNHGFLVFHVTGSCFFGGINAQSDMDFFVERSTDLRAFLIKEGFRKERGPETYVDPTVDEVWVHSPENIHIQVVRRGLLERKKGAQDFIRRESLMSDAIEFRRKYPSFKEGYKAISRAIWRAAYAAT